MIERLLVIKLDVAECEAEAWLNGMPVLRAGPDDPHAVVAVNEYTLAGNNRLDLCLWPAAPGAAETPPLTVTASGRAAAHVRLLLPRVGQPVDEASARTLAEIPWAPAAGTTHEAPLWLTLDVSLPVGFPRWRWMDAPPIDAAQLRPQAVWDFLHPLAEALAAGDPDPYLAATRWRVEELAAAYQRDARDDLRLLRQQWLALHEAGGVRWAPLKPEDLVLRRVAAGRLLECLDTGGMPFLRTLPDELGRSQSLPMRLACVEGKFYGLR